MIITARQLQDLHKSHGGNSHVTLPYRARLTPLAADYVRSKNLVLGYSEISNLKSDVKSQISDPKSQISDFKFDISPASAAFLWWCDGPCGVAKAALIAEEKQADLRPLPQPADARLIATSIKALAAEIKSGRATGGVLLVQNAALAVVYANRCPSLRAIPGTCLEAVEQGVQQIAANVLIVEYPHKTLQQVRNMLGRFLRAPRSLSDEARRQLQELATCG